MKIAVFHIFLLAVSAAATQANQNENAHRGEPLPVPSAGRTGFTRLAPEQTGILFTNWLADARSLTNQVLMNGSGLAAGDVDGDGRADLYFCRLDGPNALYRNLGDWQFEEVSEAAGAACPEFTSTAAVLADLDGTGHLDLIVNTIGAGTHFFFNDGAGRFDKAPFEFNSGKGGMSMALADIDGDGYLDVYITNYRPSALMDMPNARANFRSVDGRMMIDRINGRPLTDPDLTNRFFINAYGGVAELGQEDLLLRNQGGTNFVPVPFQSSFLDAEGRPMTEPLLDWGLSVMFRDLTGNGRPDIYVCNDFHTPDRVWINQGDGRFQALPDLALRRTSFFSMGIDFADINRDGWDDFLVLDMMSREHPHRMVTLTTRQPVPSAAGQIEGRPLYPVNTLFLNRGDGTFAEIAQLAQVPDTDWSWGVVFLDVDLNGWEDILITNGHERDGRNMDVADQLRTLRGLRRMSDREIFEARRKFPRLATPNLAFRNRGDLTFEEVGEEWGFDFFGVSHGMVLADLDNDGDLDVAVNNLNAAAGVYRNESAAPRVAVRLKGLRPNTQGIGSRVIVRGGAVPVQTQEIMAGGRYLSGDDPMRVFAAGTLTNRLEIEVLWRGGRRSLLTNVLPNHRYEICESAAESNGMDAAVLARAERSALSEAEKAAVPAPAGPSGLAGEPPLFEDVSHWLEHRHQDEPYNDFERQPLLSKRLSQLGPGLSWFDLSGNGRDDLIVAGGRGGELAVFRNPGDGKFERWKEAPFTARVTRDQTAPLGWARRGAPPVLLVGSSNYEDGLALGSSVRQYTPGQGRVGDSFPGQASSTGPLAMADVSGDGRLELFIGGRVLPGRYPEAASSALYRTAGGTWQLDQENTSALAGVGLVSGAVFTDVNGNGAPDLVLACEWGPLRLFLNEGGKLAEATEDWGLGEYSGWWNGVTSGDFNGDGKLDLAASNWGRNSIYESHRSRPLQVYYGDFTGTETVELIEAYYNPAMNKVVPFRGLDALLRAMPSLRDRFPTYESYGRAGVREILGNHFPSAQVKEANWLETTVFLNRGDHFEPVPLPIEAQLAPAFGVTAADFNGDGHEDIFLSQNFFTVEPNGFRYDAGRGLLLLGDGAGGFTALPAGESGLEIYGEQRGSAWSDFDGDGRIDLAVAQNNAETKLYKNRGAEPGLRVRLEGPPGNPSAIGATLRLIYGERMGPARHIHAGSGYWSQDSSVQILGKSGRPTHVWARRPGGEETISPLPPDTRDIVLKSSGEVR